MMSEDLDISEFILHKGAVSILFELGVADRSFNDLKDSDTVLISPNTISSRLDEAQDLGLLEKTVGDGEGRSTIEYTLTGTGDRLLSQFEDVEEDYFNLKEEIADLKTEMHQKEKEIRSLLSEEADRKLQEDLPAGGGAEEAAEPAGEGGGAAEEPAENDEEGAEDVDEGADADEEPGEEQSGAEEAGGEAGEEADETVGPGGDEDEVEEAADEDDDDEEPLEEGTAEDEGEDAEEDGAGEPGGPVEGSGDEAAETVAGDDDAAGTSPEPPEEGQEENPEPLDGDDGAEETTESEEWSEADGGAEGPEDEVGADDVYEELVQGTVEEVKERLKEDSSLDLKEVLAAEEANKDRVTLVEWLEERIAVAEPDGNDQGAGEQAGEETGREEAAEEPPEAEFSGGTDPADGEDASDPEKVQEEIEELADELDLD